MESISLKAHAKINLSLDVIGRDRMVIMRSE